VGYQNRWFLRGHIINGLTSGGISEYDFMFVMLAQLRIRDQNMSNVIPGCGAFAQNGR
jgi:hypothetical protein